MSHFHIGPDEKKKTEEEEVEAEDDPILEHPPENPVKTWDLKISDTAPGMVF